MYCLSFNKRIPSETNTPIKTWLFPSARKITSCSFLVNHSSTSGGNHYSDFYLHKLVLLNRYHWAPFNVVKIKNILMSLTSSLQKKLAHFSKICSTWQTADTNKQQLLWLCWCPGLSFLWPEKVSVYTLPEGLSSPRAHHSQSSSTLRLWVWL